MFLARFPGIVFAVWLGSCAAAIAASASAESLVKKGLEAERRMDPRAALELFQAASALKPDDAFILQRISRQYSDSTLNEPSAEKRRQLAEQALVYSKQAYALEPRNPVFVLSMAICYGKLGLYGDAQSRVDNARLIRKFAEEALALDPQYDWAHHVLGRWHTEVAELGGTKRFFAGLFYGGLPKATYGEAIDHLQKAVALAPNVVAHHIELGFALRAAGRTADARAEFQKGLALPIIEIHDESAKRRASEALREMKP